MKAVKQGSQKVTKEADIRYREYWRDNERFADLFNTVVYGGEHRIQSEELQEADTQASRLVPIPELERSIERTRDVMKVSKGARYLLLGVENQSHIHYGMPLRTLVYDVLGYIDEAKDISNQRKKEKGLTSAEFLSGMRKGDKLTPIITIVIYYGEEPWDGPLTLSEMFDEEVQQNGINQAEYRMILLQVSDSGQYHFQNEETETIFSISRDLFQGNMEKVKQQYRTQDLSQEIISMVGSITGFRGMKQEAEEGEENMCKAIDAIFEQERIKTEERMREEFQKERQEAEKKHQEAEKKRQEAEQLLEKERRTGIMVMVRMLKEFNCEIHEIYNKLYEAYGVSLEDAKGYLVENK